MPSLKIILFFLATQLEINHTGFFLVLTVDHLVKPQRCNSKWALSSPVVVPCNTSSQFYPSGSTKGLILHVSIQTQASLSTLCDGVSRLSQLLLLLSDAMPTLGRLSSLTRTMDSSTENRI